MEDAKKLYRELIQHTWFKIVLGVAVTLIVWKAFDMVWLAAILGLAALGLNQILASHGGIAGAAKKVGKKLDEELNK